MEAWLQNFKEQLLNEFGDAIQFVGLQGSRARDEANDGSDIDVVVLFDELTIEKLKRYEKMANTMPQRHLLCGFVGGMDDLQAWDKADLFTFVYDTIPLHGDISIFKPMITADDVKKFIRSTAGNVYHLALHNYLHSKSSDMIKDLYKMARFGVQGNVFLARNEFIAKLNDLPAYTNEQDNMVIERFIALKNAASAQIETDTEALVSWAKETLQAMK